MRDKVQARYKILQMIELMPDGPCFPSSFFLRYMGEPAAGGQRFRLQNPAPHMDKVHTFPAVHVITSGLNGSL